MIERAHRPGKARRTQLRLFVGGGWKAERRPRTRWGVQALSHFGAAFGTAARWQCLGRGDTCWHGTVRLPPSSPKLCSEGTQVLLLGMVLASPPSPPPLRRCMKHSRGQLSLRVHRAHAQAHLGTSRCAQGVGAGSEAPMSSGCGVGQRRFLFLSTEKGSRDGQSKHQSCTRSFWLTRNLNVAKF